MQFTVHNITHASHNVDKGIVVISFDLHFTKPEKMILEVTLLYKELLRFIEKEDKPFGKYLDSVRRSIDPHKPCEHLVFENMGDEAIRKVYEYLELYLRKGKGGEKQFKRAKKFGHFTPEQTDEMQDKLSWLMDSMKYNENRLGGENNERLFRFIEMAKKQMNDIALEIYPEILDANQRKLLQFQLLFIKEVFSMQKRVELFAHKIKHAKK